MTFLFWRRYVRFFGVVIVVAFSDGYISGSTYAAEKAVENTPIRAALIDISPTHDLPPEFSDLLFAGLSRVNELALVEREEISRILKEQQLSLALGNDRVSSSAIKAGSLLSAEAIVILKALPAKEEVIPIRVRVIGTRSGLRYWDTTVIWQTKSPDRTKQVDLLSQQLAKQLLRVKTTRTDLRLVSVENFFNREDTSQIDWLGSLLAAGLEHSLAQESGVVILERTETVPLIRERTLTTDESPELQEAEITIAGQFRLNILEDEVEVIVDLVVRRRDKEPVKSSVRSGLGNLAELQQKVNDVVLRMLELPTEESKSRRLAEAKRLADLGERHLILHQRTLALKPLLAAYALDPDSFRIQALLMHAGRAVNWSEIWSASPTGAVYQGDRLTLLFLLADVGTKLLDHPDFPHRRKADSERLYWGENIFYSYELLFNAPHLLARQLSDEKPEMKEGLNLLKPVIADVHQRYLEATKSSSQRKYEFAIMTGIKQGQWWTVSPKQALKKRLEYLELADDLENPGFQGCASITGCFAFNYIEWVAGWSNRDDLEKVEEEFLQKLSESDRPLLRISAELGKAKYILRKDNDPRLALPHYQKFIDLVVNEVLPKHPKMDNCVGNWVSANAFVYKTGKQALTDEQAGQFYSRVIRASLERAFPKSPNLWQYFIGQTVGHLEKSQQIEEAEKLLQECLECLKDNSLMKRYASVANSLTASLDGLRSRHPKLQPNGNLAYVSDVSCEIVLDLKAVHERLAGTAMTARHLMLSQLVETKSGFAIICVGSIPTKRELNKSGLVHTEQIAVLRLNAETFDIESNIVVTKPITYSRKFSFLLPKIAAQGDHLFFSIPGYGILWFQPESAPVHFSPQFITQHSPTNRPLPLDKVTELALVESKLYALGFSASPLKKSLLELDFRKGSSKVIYSPRTSEKEHPLHGWQLTSLVSNSKQGVTLLAATEQTMRGPYGEIRKSPRLIEYDPVKSTYRTTHNLPFEVDPLAQISRVRGKTYLYSPHLGLGEIDTQSAETSWLIDFPHNKRSKKARWAANRGIRLFALSSDAKQLVLLRHGGQQPSSWQLLVEDRSNPRCIVGNDWPEVRLVTDLLATEIDGLLILTREKLLKTNIFSSPQQAVADPQGENVP